MVQDAVAAYLWLIENGTPPARVVLAGESAGGGLVCAVISALLDGGHPLPAAAVAISFPPLLIQVGDHEVIRDDAITLAEKATAAGVDVSLEVWPYMIHLWHTFAYLPEAQRALERIGRFVEERTSGERR